MAKRKSGWGTAQKKLPKSERPDMYLLVWDHGEDIELFLIPMDDDPWGDLDLIHGRYINVGKPLKALDRVEARIANYEFSEEDHCNRAKQLRMPLRQVKELHGSWREFLYDPTSGVLPRTHQTTKVVQAGFAL